MGMVKVMSNCSWADQSPSLKATNYTPGRTVNGVTYKIDTITLHMVWGHLTMKSLASCFQGTREASSNYGIVDDGSVGLFVDEANRSWCSSNRLNDVRAITVEIDSDKVAPYKMTDKAVESAIKLCIDICERNNIQKMIWINDKTQALAKQQNLAEGEGIFTIHKWFADTSCPGQFLIDKMPEICKRVNDALAKIQVGDIVPMEVYEIKDGYAYGKIKVAEPEPTPTPTPTPTPAPIVVGSKVTINPGAVAGGLSKDRGVEIKKKYANGKFVDVVDKIETHYGVEEARLKRIWTWVATSSLTLVE